MEVVIELAIQRVNMKRDQAEVALKSKRTIFDNKLIKHEKLVNAFRKKDPPILTMEEMEENAKLVEEIVDKLQVYTGCPGKNATNVDSLNSYQEVLIASVPLFGTKTNRGMFIEHTV